MGDLMMWEPPFSNYSFPGVQVVPSTQAAGDVDMLVHPPGSGTFPVYLVRFVGVPAYRVHYEGMTPSNWNFPPPILRGKTSSLVKENSNWVEEFQGVSVYIETSFGKPFSDLRHFVIIGGDHVVEVISFEPEITRIDSSRKIREFSVSRMERTGAQQRGW
jgi:hypothetical protein